MNHSLVSIKETLEKMKSDHHDNEMDMFMSLFMKTVERHIQEAIVEVEHKLKIDLKNRIKFLQGIPGRDGMHGKDGRDGSPDDPQEIKNKLQSLKGDDRLDASAIKNLPTQIGGMKRSGSGVNFIFNETPSGTVNGTNTSFTLANTPKAGTLLFFVNGQLLTAGGEDYSLSTRTITVNTAPPSGSVLRATYQKA